ncbi:hypothetical protein RchiOBHm_Chr6g0263661 [Rosa chinensis]|uniref:Uncharacterized protein n=1 Tax=Rosa chinensis TaxID=74649 RepID=A0A2P6PP07_ROSCH|nr:hypothetical protein RchiOBHm_Chr6g0263661 [Rosa chinensis]
MTKLLFEFSENRWVAKLKFVKEARGRKNSFPHLDIFGVSLTSACPNIIQPNLPFLLRSLPPTKTILLRPQPSSSSPFSGYNHNPTVLVLLLFHLGPAPLLEDSEENQPLRSPHPTKTILLFILCLRPQPSSSSSFSNYNHNPTRLVLLLFRLGPAPLLEDGEENQRWRSGFWRKFELFVLGFVFHLLKLYGLHSSFLGIHVLSFLGILHIRRTWLRRLSSGDMVLGLVVANVAVFLLWRIADPIFMYKNFTIGFHFWA